MERQQAALTCSVTSDTTPRQPSPTLASWNSSGSLSCKQGRRRK